MYRRTIRLRGAGDTEDEVVDGVVLIKSWNSTGYKGVYPIKGHFAARLCGEHLGMRKTAREAALLYAKAKAKAKADKDKKVEKDVEVEEISAKADDEIAALMAKVEAIKTKRDEEIAALMGGLEVDDAVPVE